MTPAPALSASPGRLAGAGRLLAVASGQGGVGTTWFSVSLAHTLARQGKKVLLLDGDLGLANVDVQLSLLPAHDLSQVVAGQIPLSDAVTPYGAGGFDVIAGRSGGVNMAATPAARFDDLLADITELAGRYDHMILDLAAGIDPGVRRLIAEADTCLIVTTEEPTALTDAYSLIKVIARRQPRANLRIVINMASSQAAGERTYMTLRKACEEFLSLKPPLAGIIRADPHVSQAIRHQVGLFTRSPTCDAASDVESISRRLLAPDERASSS
ncbi:MAG: P-loop NTPase [Alphaproteobacteria bacterium]